MRPPTAAAFWLNASPVVALIASGALWCVVSGRVGQNNARATRAESAQTVLIKTAQALTASLGSVSAEEGGKILARGYASAGASSIGARQGAVRKCCGLQRCFWSGSLDRTSFFRIDKAMSSLPFVASAGRFTGYDPG
jgi:hypothetical protein